MFNFLPVIIAAVLPISELRGAIPLGIGLGFNPLIVILISMLANAVIFFPIYFGLEMTYERFFKRFEFVKKLVEGTQKRVKPYVDKYGIIGLAVFIGIPLPVTGVWTGTAAAWLMGLDWKKSFIAASIGVIIAGIIISILSLGLFSLV